MSRTPLGVINFRAPVDFIAELRAQADADGVTLSDLVRARVLVDSIKPLGKPRPRSRKVTRVRITPTDPALLFEVSRIGSSLDQLARRLNAVGGFSSVEFLTILYHIELQLDALVRRNHSHVPIQTKGVGDADFA